MRRAVPLLGTTAAAALLAALLAVLVAGVASWTGGDKGSALAAPKPKSTWPVVVDVDSHTSHHNTDGTTGPVLEAGQLYEIKVQGTFSGWPVDYWDDGEYCGVAQPSPMWPSPGVANGKVGSDAQWDFAASTTYTAPCDSDSPNAVKLPEQDDKLFIFTDPSQISPNPVYFSDPANLDTTGPDPSHTYRYYVTGQGKQVTFKISSFSGGQTADPGYYGVLKATIKPGCPPAEDGSAPIVGTEGNDALTGTPGDDVICGMGGNDTLLGRGGNDIIYGGPGNDPDLDGEGGVDLVYGNAGDDVIAGGDDDDILLGEAGTDVLLGDGGDDELWGGDVRDELYGGPGVDKLRGEAGNDLLAGGQDGGNGADANGDGFPDDPEELYGGPDNDTLTDVDVTGQWDPSADDASQERMYGEGGTDTVVGRGGDDFLYGGDQKDTMDGGDGNDEVHGEGGDADILHGANGNDTVRGGPGTRDELYGDAGTDSLLACDQAKDKVFGGAETDVGLVDAIDQVSSDVEDRLPCS